MARSPATAKAVAAGLVMALLVLFGTAPAWADSGKRYALVIGNSDYANVERLPNSARDAEAIAEALEALRFTVFKGTDLTGRQFESLIQAFNAAAADADTVVFYYAGHGFQLNGLNHLVPVDAVLQDRSRIGEETLVLDDVIEQIRRPSRQTIVFLDACRNNPLPPGVSDGGDGLARVGTGDGTFIAFATQPGNVSYDGSSKNSPFAEALLTHIARPGRSVSSMMIDVRNDVANRTLGRQVPWDQSSLRADFFFNPTPDYVTAGSPSTGGIAIGRAGATAALEMDEVGDDAGEEPAPLPRRRPATAPELASLPARPTMAGVERLKPGRDWFPEDEPRAAQDATGEERQFAALDPDRPLDREPQDVHSELLDPRELARSIQSDLARLGCYRLGIDGEWGPGSRAGLGRFYSEKGEAAPSLEPSAEILAMVRDETGTICPPPKASPPKQRRTVTPAPPRKQPVAQTSQPVRQAAPQLQPAPAVESPKIPGF